MAAHLAGAIADTQQARCLECLQRIAIGRSDAILSTLQMPSGVPVATFGRERRVTNAGIFAAQMLVASDPILADKAQEFKSELREKTIEKDKPR